MKRLPILLRLFWSLFVVAAVVALAFPVGPAFETWWSPVRSPGSRVENVGRDATFLWFQWVSRKNRLAPSPGVDVTMDAAGDRFDLTLYNDVSRPDEAPCTRLLPWSRSLAVGVGEHRQPYCVEIPRTVGPHDPIRLIVVAKYRGFGGLWTLRVSFPPVTDPGR